MAHRRLHSVMALFLVISACAPQCGLAQDEALLKRLQLAERVQALDAPGLKPWHLKLSVELHDTKGKPAETGTIEEWWVAPGKFRRVFTFPSYSATELSVGDKLLRTTGKAQPPYLMRQLLEDQLHPVRLAVEANSFRLKLRSERVEKTLVDCIVLHPLGVSLTDPDTFPRFCFRQGDTALLLKSDSTQTEEVRSIGTFQNRYAAAELVIVMAGFEVASQRVVSFGLATEVDARLHATDGLTEVRSDPILIAPDVDGVWPIWHPQPLYPGRAMRGRRRGVAVVRAVFGSDGRAREATILAASNDFLSETAVDTVRHSKLDPYKVDGRPVAVEILVAVRLR